MTLKCSTGTYAQPCTYLSPYCRRLNLCPFPPKNRGCSCTPGTPQFLRPSTLMPYCGGCAHFLSDLFLYQFLYPSSFFQEKSNAFRFFDNYWQSQWFLAIYPSHHNAHLTLWQRAKFQIFCWDWDKKVHLRCKNCIKGK